MSEQLQNCLTHSPDAWKIYSLNSFILLSLIYFREFPLMWFSITSCYLEVSFNKCKSDVCDHRPIVWRTWEAEHGLWVRVWLCAGTGWPARAVRPFAWISHFNQIIHYVACRPPTTHTITGINCLSQNYLDATLITQQSNTWFLWVTWWMALHGSLQLNLCLTVKC